ncbi:Aspartate/glutamate/uridylate kinase [Geopyxis carbonaria]|nr:Aspartate/glutamate/uridylate kinase [Geopyxis carbonaria]
MPPSAVMLETPPPELSDESSTSENLLYNPENAPWIVQKYGGTSLGKFAEDVADIIKPRIETNKIAIVCSARSTGTKAEGTTSRLLRAAAVALSPGSDPDSTVTFSTIVDAILEDHLSTGRQHLRSPTLLSNYVIAATAECHRLTALLSAAQTLSEISPKTRDAIIGTGEKLSCLFMTALLTDRGIAAEYINLENIIPTAHGSSAQELTQEFYDAAGAAIAERVLSQSENRIPVVTGFFGTVPGSILGAVGRGYTDLCAALLAVGCRAQELQVWKEVDGIFTADPRKVPQAQLIASITPEETAELTYWGSEVIHPFTMDQVIRAHIPIRIKNTRNPFGSGTVIFPDTATPSRPGSPGNPALKPRMKRPTAVTTKDEITVLNVLSNRKSLSHGFLAGIFRTLDNRRLSVDLISTSEVHVSMALHTPSGANTGALDAAIHDLQAYGSVEVLRGLTILAVVGAHMRQMVGVAGEVFTTLAKEGVNIEMISQGSSEINISCVVKESDALKAMTILHTRLFLYSGDQ